MRDYEFFSASELACPCGRCDGGEMDDDFMLHLTEVRRKLAVPFFILSAYRCPAYNSEISKTGVDGPHTSGKAVDIRCNSRLRFQIIREMITLGYNRFGVNNGSLHVDGDTRKAADVCWDYY